MQKHSENSIRSYFQSVSISKTQLEVGGKLPPLRQCLNPGVMAHAFDPRAQQAEASLVYRESFRTARDDIMRSCLKSLKMFYANFTISLNSNCEEVLITQENSCNFFDPQSS